MASKRESGTGPSPAPACSATCRAAEFAVRLISPYSHVCLGQDINLVAGRPCADPAQIPSLVQEDGFFKTSGMHRTRDAADGNQDHVILRDCLIEVEAQILRFMDLTGKKPEYLHSHSYSTPATWRAMEIMGETYGIPLVRDLLARYNVSRLASSWNKKPFTLEEQMKADPMECILGDREFPKSPSASSAPTADTWTTLCSAYPPTP